MSDTRNLFIVTDIGIFFGRGTFHKDLAKRCDIKKEWIIGGGIFEQKEEEWILFGKSADFGKVDTDMLNLHINNGDVFWFGRPLRLDVSFVIDEDREEQLSDRF